MKDPNKLFDFIDIMVKDKRHFDKLSPYQVGKHYFMINRFMSINHPVIANHLQHIKINGSEVVQYWHSTLSRLYSSPPGWMYVKTKKSKSDKVRKAGYSDETIKEYCSRMGFSRRQVEDSIKFFPSETETELKKFQKLLKQ